MAYEKIKRNRYYEYPMVFDHTSENHFEDMQEFHIPMERMHNSNLHDWGIARGLEVNGNIGEKEVIINPGVAINGNGQLISLSSLGHGYIDQGPPGKIGEVQVPVHLYTESIIDQTVYVTIQFLEILRDEGSGGRMEQVPWLRLQPVSGTGAYVDDGTSIILAIAEINSKGKLMALKAEDNTIPYQRRLIGETIEELRIRRSEKVERILPSGKVENSVEETTSGKICPSNGGGLQITVANSGDFEVRANEVVAKDSAGREALKLNTNEGDLEVKDGLGRKVLQFDGGWAALYIGANGNEGDLIIRDNSGNKSAKIDGNTGTLEIKKINARHATDQKLHIDARYVHIHGRDLTLDGRSGNNKRALVDWNNKLIINYNGDYANGVDVASRLRTNVDGIYRTLGGNPARYADYRILLADAGTVTETVDLRSPRRFTAFTSIIGMDPRHDFDAGDAFAVDVYKIDDSMTPGYISNGAHFGPPGSASNIRAPFYMGTGQYITFRARSWQDAAVIAIGVVFYE